MRIFQRSAAQQIGLDDLEPAVDDCGRSVVEGPVAAALIRVRSCSSENVGRVEREAVSEPTKSARR